MPGLAGLVGGPQAVKCEGGCLGKEYSMPRGRMGNRLEL